MIKLTKSFLGRLSQAITRPSVADPIFSRVLVAQGSAMAVGVRSTQRVDKLSDVEFSVFSQWGEDGIIEWIVSRNGEMPETFVEFGVEDYRESNTRFLLCNRNWRGLVIDGSPKNIQTIRNDQVSWRHDLTSIAAFIDRENINTLIADAGIQGEIGILSVDIDGNDYWVWEAIEVVRPHVVIIEYNSQFGDRLPLSVPYVPAFVRSKAHYSNLYWGASIEAFVYLASLRGYTLIGTNSAGVNAFFVRNDRFSRFEHVIGDRRPWPSRFRESRDPSGQLNFARGLSRVEAISDMPITNVNSGFTQSLFAFGDLYSNRWAALTEGLSPATACNPDDF